MVLRYACIGDDTREDFPSMVRDKKGLSCSVLVNSSSHGNLKRHVDAVDKLEDLYYLIGIESES